MPMKRAISLSALSCGSGGRLTNTAVPQLLDETIEQGFQGIEVDASYLRVLAAMMRFRNDKGEPEMQTTALYLRTLCDSRNLRIISFRSPRCHDGHSFNGVMKRGCWVDLSCLQPLKDAVHLCELLGADLMQIPFGIPVEGTISPDMITELRNIAQLALACNTPINIAFNVQPSTPKTAAAWPQGIDVVRAVHMPNFGLGIDLALIAYTIHQALGPLSGLARLHAYDEAVDNLVAKLAFNVMPKKTFFIKTSNYDKVFPHIIDGQEWCLVTGTKKTNMKLEEEKENREDEGGWNAACPVSREVVMKTADNILRRLRKRLWVVIDY